MAQKNNHQPDFIIKPNALISKPVTRKMSALCCQAGTICLFAAAVKTQAQEAVRPSLAGVEAAELQRKANDLDYYNLKLGPVNMRFLTSLEVGLLDNVNYTEHGKIADAYFKPTATIQASWPISPGNSFLLATDIGYTKYIRTTGNDHLDITPNSSLTYHLYTGDFAINIHDQFSVSQDVSETPTVNGTGNINQLENTSGFGVDWDLHDLVVSFGYDHDWTAYPGSIFSYSDHNSDLFNVKAAFTINPTSTIGLEAGTGVTYYSQPTLSDNHHFSLGAFYQNRLTDYIQIKAKIGAVYYSFGTNTFTPSTSDAKGWYGDITVSQNVNKSFDHSISFGREFTVATAVDLLDLYYIHYQANLHFIHNVPVAIPLFYEHGKTLGFFSEKFDRYGAGVNVSYLITKKLTSSAKYSFLDKNSDQLGNDYLENQLVFDLTYSF